MPEVVFPLGPKDDGYEELLRAAETIERVAERLHTRIVTRAGSPWLSDCEWVGRLDAAAMVVRSCLKEV